MLSKLARRLNQPVVALHGMGGIGKTRLAVEYAWRHARDYSALLFVSAETPEILDASLASLAATLSLPQQNEPEDPVRLAAVLAWLAANSNWLLILDNVDDEKAAGAVVDLLPKLANGHTLITARYERFPPAVTMLRVDVLAPEPARDFLLARTQAGRRADEDDSSLATELAEELGYLALALEQAGAFISAQRISFERYLAYWRDERARVLDSFDRTASGSNHDKGLAAVWTTSVARLSAQGRRLFDRIAFLAPEPIPEFLLDVQVPNSRSDTNEHPQDTNPHPEEPRSGVSKDALEAGVAALGPFEKRPSSAPQGEAGDKGSDAQDEDKFDTRAALGELYAYSLAAPTEIEGRYRQPAFTVHRLVQDFARASMDEKRKDEMLREASAWVNAAFDGDPGDVRNWPRLDPLAVHAQMVAGTADKAGIAESTARLMNQVAQLFRGQARNREAEPLIRRALEIYKQSLGPDHPRVAILFNNVATLLQSTNRLDEAEPLMRDALDIDQKNWGPDHPHVAIDLNNLATMLQDTNRLAEAEPLMRRALEIDEKNFTSNHPNVAIRLNNLSRLLQDTNRLAEAEPLIHRALKIFTVSLGHDHPNTKIAVVNYRILLRERGASEEEAEAKVAAAMRGE